LGHGIIKKGSRHPTLAAISWRLKMDEIKLSTNLINGILQYLGSKPFAEVAGLIQAIQQEAAKQGAQPVAAEEPAAE
jgi:hypothetical protein